jgi:hypothetical protein
MSPTSKALLISLTFSLCATSAFAQVACPEGRTANGQCVDPDLAAASRNSAVIYSQPKLSYTHYPVLPSLDLLFRYPHQLNPDPNSAPQIGTPPLIPLPPFPRG